MNKTIIELLKEDRTALKAIHDTFLIDFTAPLFAFQVNGKFTVNQIIKTASAEGYNPGNGKMIVCIAGIKYREDDIYTTEITPGGNIEIDQKIHLYSNGKYRRTKIHEFWRKSDFNEYRKQENTRVYIICQKSGDLAKKNQHKPDFTSRFKLADARKWGYMDSNETYYGELDLIRTDDNGTHTIYNSRGNIIYRGRDEYKTLDELIDKSGYITRDRRADLKRRAAALRAEREKAAYIKTDNAATIADLDALYIKTRAAIIKELSAAYTVEHYKTVAKKLDYFHGIADALEDLERLKARDAAREYSSIEKFTAAADAIRAKFEALTA